MIMSWINSEIRVREGEGVFYSPANTVILELVGVVDYRG